MASWKGAEPNLDHTTGVTVDIARIPFSRYGAYISVTQDETDGAAKYLTIRNVRRRFGEDVAFHLKFLRNGADTDWSVSATPVAVKVESSEGDALIYIRDDRSLIIDGRGLDVWLKQASRYGYGIDQGNRCLELISVPQRSYSMIYVQRGHAVLSGPIQPGHGDMQIDRREELTVSCEEGRVTLSLEISIVERDSDVPISVDDDLQSIRREWDAFERAMPHVPADREDFCRLTWYNLWSCFVRAEDNYKYDAMLMSKKFMSSVWTWDHCFNALAIAPADLNAAIEQFLLPFELQAESGALPDMWNPNSEVVWGVTKPPIHGWCFSKIMSRFEVSESVLRKVYRHLVMWTEWWMNRRDFDQDGIPEYPQGCDSGWDNSTVFDLGYFIESPDLSAYLVLQMKTLSDIANRLGDSESARKWEERSRTLLCRLYEHSWVGDRFVAKQSGTHKYVEKPTSLLALMPLVLGDILDKSKLDELVESLERSFLTENGPATEALESKWYQYDGYWRGPIWAPSTYLLVDGLRRGGRNDLATRIAEGFCDMVEHKAKGNYENFDPKTGVGLRAPGYTWTASVYMLLVWEYLA